jgi:7-cyano-7-deazaguanine synthase
VGSVILLSGGLDSLVCLAVDAERSAAVACLFIDYGQPARQQERQAAATAAARYNVPLHEARLPIALGAMDAPAGEAGPRIVPGRNLSMLAAATSLAATLGADEVVIGASGADHAAYPDCRPEFIARLSEVTSPAYGVQVVAPLQSLSRAQIVDLARQYGIVASDVWSCYTPIDGKPCGTCDSCLQEAL